MVMLMMLCRLYPEYAFIIQAVGFLDMFRMWIKMYR